MEAASISASTLSINQLHLTSVTLKSSNIQVRLKCAKVYVIDLNLIFFSPRCFSELELFAANRSIVTSECIFNRPCFYDLDISG